MSRILFRWKTWNAISLSFNVFIWSLLHEIIYLTCSLKWAHSSTRACNLIICLGSFRFFLLRTCIGWIGTCFFGLTLFILQLSRKLLKLSAESIIRVDEVPLSLDKLDSFSHRQSNLLHNVGYSNCCTSWYSSETVDKDLPSTLNWLFYEFYARLEVCLQVSWWAIKNAYYFVLKDCWEFRHDAHRNCEDMCDPMLLEEEFVIGSWHIT